MDFAVPADDRLKIKESEKEIVEPCQRSKNAVEYELVVPILIGTHRATSKFLENVLEQWEDSRLSRLKDCWDRLEYWEESWRAEETCCHSDSSDDH